MVRIRNRISDPDTDIGGPLRNFPQTNRSAIVAMRSQELQVRQRGFDAILESYWKPVYKYIRIKWNADNEDAKDLTQGFFVNAFEKNYFADFDATKASFQTFLRTCADGFVANQRKAEQRLKRGGGLEHVSLDFQGADNELALHPPSQDLTPEQYFEREWLRSLFLQAVEVLREKCDQTDNRVRFQLFQRYDLEESTEEVSYTALATEFGLTTTTVNNQLAAARRDFRRILLDKLREMTATEAEFQNQARELFGLETK
ncbi:MAG TPA: sigma-70 family RNA polymerase sigma factor [Pyrinomonadaceae bacterium]|nr:sigma-70 family RNA polymerase sigma factor [Pyrinomonadaceae bacterium]